MESFPEFGSVCFGPCTSSVPCEQQQSSHVFVQEAQQQWWIVCTLWLSLTSGQDCLCLKLISNMRSLYCMQLPTQTSSCIHIRLSAMSVQYFHILYMFPSTIFIHAIFGISHKKTLDGNAEMFINYYYFYSIKHAHKQRWKHIYQTNSSCASKKSCLTDHVVMQPPYQMLINLFWNVWAKVGYQNDLVLSPPITASHDCVLKHQAFECKIT